MEGPVCAGPSSFWRRPFPSVDASFYGVLDGIWLEGRAVTNTKNICDCRIDDFTTVKACDTV